MYVVHLKRDEWDTLTFDEYQEGINKLDCKQFKFVKMKGHTLIKEEVIKNYKKCVGIFQKISSQNALHKSS